MPPALSTSASDWALGRSGRVVSRRQSSAAPSGRGTDRNLLQNVDMMLPGLGAPPILQCAHVRSLPAVLIIRALSRSFREGERVHRVLDAADAQVAAGE